MAVGAVIGGVSGGVAAYVGGEVGGTLARVIVGTTQADYVANGGLIWMAEVGGGIAGGAAGGATAGALNSAYYGGNVGDAALAGAGYGAMTGAAFGLMRVGWQCARDYTDMSSLRQWDHMNDPGLEKNAWQQGPMYDSTGSLMTAGPRLVFGGYRSLLSWLSMAPEGSANNNYMGFPYTADSIFGHFVNDISKVHDFMNSFMYSDGCVTSRSLILNTLADTYSMLGTIPAGMYTGLALYGTYLQPAFYMYRE
jgi:hypothetical protein